MSPLRIEAPAGDAGLQDWRHVHNVIIPTAVLSLEEVRERSQRNHLQVAYLDDVPVGCTTVRPPTKDPSTATVIARVLAPHRRQGFGTELCDRGMAHARALGATVIETVVLASNTDGLAFARARGFVEFERYVLPGDTIPFVTLRLA